MRAVAIRAALPALALAALVAADRSAAPIFGFSSESLAAERRVEARFLALPSERRARAFHHHLTTAPHPAGSARNQHLAAWQREHWQAWGLDEVQIVTHEVLVPRPREIVVERVTPAPWTASSQEPPPDVDAGDIGPAYHAFSASGDRTGALVYAGHGEPEEYDWLESQGIRLSGRIALVRHSVPYGYRGFKAYTAQQRGLAGILLFSDPDDHVGEKGDVYPSGPWRPDSYIQRGSIAFDFIAPGDPLTPGWASVPHARRIDPRDAATLPGILSVPIATRDARALLESIGGPEAPASWQGGMPLTYRAGGTDTTVRMRVDMENAIRPVGTVIGRVRGRDLPDQEIIVGNHRDAWVFGGVDPSSGSASLMELARALGTLVRDGHRPRRTIVLASWDAEELALTSSTEWGEQYASDLRKRAVAYINVDSAVSGHAFTASAVPSLARVIAEAARDVRDPGTRLSVAGAAADRRQHETGAAARPTAIDLVNTRIGSGSDYAVFLHHLGIPVADLTFAGPYGVYHSIYDSHEWVARFGDPGFRYHAALTRVWGLVALRLANADVLPLDCVRYADTVGQFVDEIARGAPAGLEPALAPLTRALGRFREAAGIATRRAEEGRLDRTSRLRLDAALMQVERAFIDDAGLPGRPWYKHIVFAPDYSYAPKILPNVRDAIDSRDPSRLAAAARQLAGAMERGAALLEAAAGSPVDSNH
jgi:N-acetylated-alpha-linked acidic dipeptidase